MAGCDLGSEVTWDAQIPNSCYPCLNAALASPLVRTVVEADLRDPRFAELAKAYDLENSDGFVCRSIVRVVGEYNRRAVEEIGIDPGSLGDDEGIVTQVRQMNFSCHKI